MRPPAWFVSLLASNHPLLRVRWASHLAKWCIEQKAYVAPSEVYYLKRRKARLESWIANPKPGESARVTEKNRKTLAAVSEELVSALEDRRVICFPDALNQQTYDMICAGEHARYGGYARFAEEMETAEERAEGEAERLAENKRMAFHSENYEAVDFIGRKKTAALHPGADFNELLHGKKSNTPAFQLEEF